MFWFILTKRNKFFNLFDALIVANFYFYFTYAQYTPLRIQKRRFVMLKHFLASAAILGLVSVNAFAQPPIHKPHHPHKIYHHKVYHHKVYNHRLVHRHANYHAAQPARPAIAHPGYGRPATPATPAIPSRGQ